MLEGVRIYPNAGEHGNDLWEALSVDIIVIREAHHTYYQLEGVLPTDWHIGMLISDGENGAHFEAIIESLTPQGARLRLLTNYRHHVGVWCVNAHDSRQNFALNLLVRGRMID